MPLRLLFVAAAGDGAGSLESWAKSLNHEAETALTYTGAFFSLCAELDARFMVISPADNNRRFVVSSGQARNIVRSDRGSGFSYHVGLLWMSLRLLFLILKFRPSVAFISDRVAHWIVLAPARLLGVKLVLSCHVRLYDKAPRGVRKLLLFTEHLFLRFACSGILAVSSVVAEQLRGLLPPCAPLRVFRGLWARSGFDAIRPAQWSGDQLNILYVGRVERSKGVFDLIEAVNMMSQHGTRLEICGDGSAIDELNNVIAAAGLTEKVTVHGHCGRAKILERMAWSHVLVVPTRREFSEGYNKVAVEGVLARRPVVSSSVIEPVLSDILPAAVTAIPNHVASYADALTMLASDHALYQEKVRGAEAVREQFFDPQYGWRAQAETLLRELGVA